jgi:hypothetical protein
MLASFLITLCVALGQGPGAPPPFESSRWDIQDPGGHATPYLGQPALFLDNGIALLRESSFADGTIDFDIAMHGHASFAGVVFRAASGDDYELVYLRPHRSRQPDALQYTPLFGGAAGWQLYSGEGYTGAAELPLNRWVHVRLVAAGYTARLFVDGATQPQLVVTDLKRPWAHGQVGLWGGLGGAHFSNVVVSSTATTAPARPPEAPAGKGILVDWEISPAWETATVRPDVLPAAPVAWTAVRAEASGMVNISRFRKSVRTTASAAGRSRDLAFARHVLVEPAARHAKLEFAYSDAIHIFLNGKLLFAGESAFRSRDPSFLGIASLGPDAIYLDLNAGRNELVFAVSETFGGWGFAAKLERQ